MPETLHGLALGDIYYKGNSEGQNINYYYPHTWGSAMSVVQDIKYSKKLIENDGTILGNFEFIISPILKVSDVNFYLNVEDEEDGLSIEWTGFSEEIKNILSQKEVKLTVECYAWGFGKTFTFCSKSSEKQIGRLKCTGEEVKEKFSDQCTPKAVVRPDPIDYKIMEIVDYNFKKCNLPNEI